MQKAGNQWETASQNLDFSHNCNCEIYGGTTPQSEQSTPTVNTQGGVTALDAILMTAEEVGHGMS